MPEFNPYKEWLRLETTEPTYYQLLGITLREDDPQAIRQHAIQRVAKLQQITAGDRIELRDQLIRRIKKAAKCLLNKQARQRYDQRLVDQQRKLAHSRRTASLTPQTPMTKQADASEVSSESTDFRLELDSASSQVSEDPPPAFAVDPTPEKTQPSAQLADQSGSDRQRKLVHAVEHKAESKLVIPGTPSGARNNVARKLKQKQKRLTAIKVCLGLALISLLGIGFLITQQTDLIKNVARRRVTNQAPVAANNSSPPNELDDVEPLPDFEPKSPPISAPAPSTNWPADQRPMPTAPIVPTLPTVPEAISTLPEATPADPANVEPTLAERQRLGDLLTQAKQALSKRDTKRAQQILQQAAELPSRVQDTAKQRRLATLTEHVAAYWSAAQQQVQRFQGGEEIMIGKTHAIVVERSASRLVLRANGKNRAFSIDAMPDKLAQACADLWLDSSAASTKVLRGAMMFASAQDNQDRVRQQVRQLWRQASATRQVDLGDLEVVLDDQYDLSK